MSENVRESVSALMDGEADELELRRLLSDSGNTKAEISDIWSRYHLVQDVMHNEQMHGSLRHLDISAQVSQAISDEGTTSVAKLSSSWWRPVAGFAVAASVAAAMVIGVQGTGSFNLGSGQPAIASVDPSISSSSVSGRVYPLQGASLQASSTGSVVNYSASQLPGGLASSRAMADLEAEKRLQKYLLRHTEQAALNNGQGMISFARVASFEQDE